MSFKVCSNIFVTFSPTRQFPPRRNRRIGLKNRFDTLCEGFGMSASTAFNIFVRTVVRKRSIPFKIEIRKKTQYTKKVDVHF